MSGGIPSQETSLDAFEPIADTASWLTLTMKLVHTKSAYAAFSK